MDYKKYLKIDKDNLDEECINQPVLYDEYASQVPDLIHEMEICKIEMEELRADLYKQNVINALEQGEKKPTEKAIENQIILDKSFQTAQDDYYEAKKKAEKGKIIRETFMQRKEMIRGLIELHNSTYFCRAETKTDKSVKESYDNKKLKRRRGQ
tara:strand:- start:31460 stop:31921 length:462 start_codon:yes stop_codon:yes gene_type:complete